jgi:hypothetical protein
MRVRGYIDDVVEAAPGGSDGNSGFRLEGEHPLAPIATAPPPTVRRRSSR